MAAANATVKTMLQEGILEHCRKREIIFITIKKLQQKHKIIKEVRGMGLMLAAQLNIEAAIL